MCLAEIHSLNGELAKVRREAMHMAPVVEAACDAREQASLIADSPWNPMSPPHQAWVKATDAVDAAVDAYRKECP
jgi:hypothetical protein